MTSRVKIGSDWRGEIWGGATHAEKRRTGKGTVGVWATTAGKVGRE
jgi:hypothetical protein